MLNKTLACVSVAATAALLYYSWLPFTGAGGTEPPSGNPIHFVSFLVYAAIIFAAATRFTGTKKSVVASVFIAVAVGTITELGQLFVPGRFCDPADWLVDVSGVLVGLVAALVVQYCFLKIKPRKHIKHSNK